eukprot:868374-Amorphochlora_amoeboformis.AAC.1
MSEEESLKGENMRREGRRERECVKEKEFDRGGYESVKEETDSDSKGNRYFSSSFPLFPFFSLPLTLYLFLYISLR